MNYQADEPTNDYKHLLDLLFSPLINSNFVPLINSNFVLIQFFSIFIYTSFQQNMQPKSNYKNKKIETINLKNLFSPNCYYGYPPPLFLFLLPRHFYKLWLSYSCLSYVWLRCKSCKFKCIKFFFLLLCFIC